jgi:hypothetical protein
MQAANHFTLQRRRSQDGTPRLGNWGGVGNENRSIDGCVAGSPAYLRHLATSSLSGRHLREAPCNIQRAQAQLSLSRLMRFRSWDSLA